MLQQCSSIILNIVTVISNKIRSIICFNISHANRAFVVMILFFKFCTWQYCSRIYFHSLIIVNAIIVHITFILLGFDKMWLLLCIMKVNKYILINNVLFFKSMEFSFNLYTKRIITSSHTWTVNSSFPVLFCQVRSSFHQNTYILEKNNTANTWILFFSSYICVT